MKKYIALLTIAAFAVAAQAGDKACADKDKAACAGKDKAACADQAKAGGCCAKSATVKKVVQSPKAASQAGG
jgi:hypothetical protein